MERTLTLLERKNKALSGTLGNWLSRLLWVGSPLLGYTLVEALNHNNGWTDFSLLQVGLNLIWYYLIAGGIFLLLGRRNLAAGVSAVLFWVIGMANHYVISSGGVPSSRPTCLL